MAMHPETIFMGKCCTMIDTDGIKMIFGSSMARHLSLPTTFRSMHAERPRYRRLVFVRNALPLPCSFIIITHTRLCVRWNTTRMPASNICVVEALHTRPCVDVSASVVSTCGGQHTYLEVRASPRTEIKEN